MGGDPGRRCHGVPTKDEEDISLLLIGHGGAVLRGMAYLSREGAAKTSVKI